MSLRKMMQLAVLGLVLAQTAGADTVGWRMDGDGRYLDAKPPTSWSTTDSVVWKTAFDTWSNASPVLLEDAGLIITLMEPDEIIAVKASDGTIAWRASTRDVFSKDVKAHKANGWTTATPVSDGRHVFTLFGTGVVAAHDLEGKRVWARHLQQPEHRWGNSASPVLAGGRLIVHVVDLIGLDPATGKEVWRSTSPAKWGSPVVTRIADTDVVITPAGDVFKAVSGSRLSSEIGSVEFSTPVVQDGHVYFIEKKATAVRLPKALDQPFETLWTGRLQGSRHYASPVIHDGLIYAVSREQKFSILDAESGELLHERQLDLDPEGGSNSAYPSITLAGNKIFVSTQNGTTAVLEPGREYQELARNSIEGFRSTPVFDGERMYLRAFDHLYCFGSGEGASSAGP